MVSSFFFVDYWWIHLDQGHKKDGNAFGWQERYYVALGIAEALDYLHYGCAEPVIHRDVKSSNVLLSDDFEPQVLSFSQLYPQISFQKVFFIIHLKHFILIINLLFVHQLSDFGLASWASGSSHFICTDVAGTFGYVVSSFSHSSLFSIFFLY